MLRWDHVFVHHSAGSDTDSIEADEYRRHHLSLGWRDIGYHFVVEQVEGRGFWPIGGRPLNMVGSHCPGWNKRALGVCLAGNFTLEPPRREQLEVAAKLVAGLCDAFNIPTDHVHQHRWHRATECPGDAFPFDEFLGLVDGHRVNGDA